MDPQPATPAHEALDASASAGGAPARTPLERKTAMMEELAELSMQMARAAARRALAAEAVAEAAEAATALPPSYIAPPYPAVPSEPADADALAASAAAIADPHLAFHRAARAVRTSVALWRQLEREKDADAAAAALAAAVARRERAAARRLSAGRIVERVAHDHYEAALPGKDRDAEAIIAAQAATREARERLEDEDLFGDLADLPLSEIVARVCRDVGLSPDWPGLAGEDWARAEIGGGPQGGPQGGPHGPAPVGEPLAPFVGASSGGGPRAHGIPPQEPRPPRARSARWRRRHDPEPPEPPQTLRVVFVDGADGSVIAPPEPHSAGARPAEPDPPPTPRPARSLSLDFTTPPQPVRNAPMDIANPWLD
jgi:hypothetical protein